MEEELRHRRDRKQHAHKQPRRRPPKAGPKRTEERKPRLRVTINNDQRPAELTISSFTVESSISTHFPPKDELHYPGVQIQEESNNDERYNELSEEERMPPPKPKATTQRPSRLDGKKNTPRDDDEEAASVLDLFGLSKYEHEPETEREQRHKRTDNQRVQEFRVEEDLEEEKLQAPVHIRRKKKSPSRQKVRKKKAVQHRGEKSRTPGREQQTKFSDEKFAKYIGMLKSGLPERIVRSAMAADSVVPPKGFFQNTAD